MSLLDIWKKDEPEEPYWIKSKFELDQLEHSSKDLLTKSVFAPKKDFKIPVYDWSKPKEPVDATPLLNISSRFNEPKQPFEPLPKFELPIKMYEPEPMDLGTDLFGTKIQLPGAPLAGLEAIDYMAKGSGMLPSPMMPTSGMDLLPMGIQRTMMDPNWR